MAIQQRRGDGGGRAAGGALGWVSIGLGLAEVLRPNELGEWFGLRLTDERRALLRAIGVRELVTGVGLLAQPESGAWRWARLGGDLMDITLLGRALADEESDHERVGRAAAAVVGIGLLDLLSAGASSETISGAVRERVSQAGTIEVRQSVTLLKSPEELYGIWRNLTNLPRLMRHLEEVTVVDDRVSRWVARAPAGLRVSWDAQLTEDRPGQVIAWRSLPGADVSNEGRVEFRRAPGDRGTELRVHLTYAPPGGPLGAGFAKLFGEAPDQQIYDDLRRFKQVMETGEVARSSATLDGNKLTDQKPGQPRP